MENLSRLLKRASKFNGKDVAAKSGLSRAYITELIKGDKRNPSFAAVTKIERAVSSLEAAAAKKSTKTKTRNSAKIQKRQGVAGKRS